LSFDTCGFVFGTGITLAIFHSIGSIPFLSDLLKKSVKVAFWHNFPFLTHFRMFTMTDICLLVYFLPHVSLCGFIRYLIKYKFATNDDSGVSQKLIYFYHKNSPVNESRRCRKQCRKWYARVLPMINTQICKQMRKVDGKVCFWLNINTDIYLNVHTVIL